MSRKRVALIGILAMLTIGSVLPSDVLRTVSVPDVHAASHSIRLSGAAFNGWNGTNPGPPISISKGDSVTMSLLSTDGGPHYFIIDVGKSGITNTPNCSVDKCSPLFSSTTVPTTFPFTVDFGPGTYTYYCSIHLNMMVGTFKVPGPDYGVSSSPSSLTIPQGTNSNSTISVTSLNNFAGSVMLSSSISSPMGLMTSSFNINPVGVPAGGTAKSNFTISAPANTSPGLYSITVTATNSTTSRPTTLSVTVPIPDFSVVASPASLAINSGISGNSTLTITGSNGFSGTVSLSAMVPSGRGVATPSPMSVMLSSTSTSATSRLTISSALGTFNATVIATSGSTSHSTQVLVNGPDFTITANPTNLSVNQGSSGTLTITLSGANGFSGSVSLTAFSSNGGPPISADHNSLQVPATGTVSSVLTVTASSSGAYSVPISPGSYTITVNATIGTLSHVKTIPLTVTSSSGGVGFLTSPVVIGGIIGAVVIIGVAVYALSRRSKK